MKKLIAYLFLAFVFFTSCKGQDEGTTTIRAEQAPGPITGDTVTKTGGEVRCIFRDSKNNLWFATNGEGVYKYISSQKVLIRYTDKQGLCSNYVWNIEEGSDGKIWFKTNLRTGITDAVTVCYFDGTTFTTLKADEHPPATYNYLHDDLVADFYYNGKSLATIKLPHTSPVRNKDTSRFDYNIYCSCKDRNGNLWFGTHGAGICKYDGKTYTWLNEKGIDFPVRAIFEDRNGTLWIGNNGDGLFRYDGKTLTNITKKMKLTNPDLSHEGYLSRVWTITDDKQGNLWIGTIDAGVWMFDGKTFTNYTTKDGLGIDFIWTIYKDKNAELWFGTDGFGAYTFDGKRFKPFTAKQ